MSENATLTLNGKKFKFPIVEGSEGEKGINISGLRNETGYITLDEGYGNTGSCQSQVTFVDGDHGILRYRGIPIEELATNFSFPRVAYLIIYGELPTEDQYHQFSDNLTRFQMIHEDMKFHFQGFPSYAHPMAILSAMINAAGCFIPELNEKNSAKHFDMQATRLLSQVRTLSAYAYRKSLGLPAMYPKRNYNYTQNFLHMMFSTPGDEFEPDPAAVAALDLIFLLHADHEQNCSTSTVRMVASSRSNLFASAAAGVCALWGYHHGGANQAVLEMLHKIEKDGDDGTKFIENVKDADSKTRLMGFGHRVYKNHDPRALIIKQRCDTLLDKLNINGPLFDIAKKLEEVALNDDYFKERNLYPNVDFYSGLIMEAIGIPREMFTVIFAIGRMPGWIANYKEVIDNTKGKIYRPRQIYQGKPLRHVDAE
ncbi:MAG: citrate synthase [Deltaproteobacteria bacterium]|nr:citrate synthase [Deltaproteobacteria bacterium]